MSSIRILSDHLANQIAAGEVVERPASVVKELLENSLDAGADRITIEVEGGGTRMIRVVDNGCGMDRDDVLLCLERHATSKLRDKEGLEAITSLGFRGEAIPSIASVSRMIILSRTARQETGTRVEIRSGTLHAVHEQGCARGTVVEVRHLFATLPARKKFLKSRRTELFHIEETIKNQALAHPQVAFHLRVDGRRRLDYPAAPDKERLRAVYRYHGPLLALDLRGEQGERIAGFLLLPQEVSTSTARLRLLVNKRPVQDRILRQAVLAGLRDLLMRSMQPAGLVSLSLDPAEIDVNVHPAKREIRFRDVTRLRRLVEEAVRQAVERHQQDERHRIFAPDPDPALPPPDAMPTRPPARTDRPVQKRIPGNDPAAVTAERTSGPVGTDSGLLFLADPEPTFSTGPDAPSAPHPHPSPASDSGLILIGQLLNLYLLCERAGELVVIDQHAAHERILYSRLREGYARREVPVQNLLFPKTVELEPELAETAEKQKEAVREMGIRAEPFGGLTWIVKGVPAMLESLEPAETLREVLAALGPGRSREQALPERVDRLLAGLACRAAIKAGDRLCPEEMVALLNQMQNSEFFTHCPHGRPVMKTFTRQEIQQWFHRT